MSGGVYVYRTRKPGARLNLPIISRHFAYVGETTSFHHRHIEHVQGGGKYGAVAKPWSDLDPVVWLRIQLPPWKWLLRSVETVLIVLTWPAYNIQKNRWNPRRIPPWAAVRQRATRDRGRHPFHVTALHGVAWGLLAVLVAYVYWRAGR